MSGIRGLVANLSVDHSPSPSDISPSATFVHGLLRLAYRVDVRPTKGRVPEASRKVICDRYRFLFCGVPLAASSSLLRMFRDTLDHDAGVKIERRSLSRMLEQSPSYATYMKFTFVRNPWSRVVSCYQKKIVNANTVGKIKLLSRSPGLYPKMPFVAFVDWLGSDAGRDELADPHWVSQHRLLSSADGKIVCDRIGRVEQLEDDLASILSELRLPAMQLPRVNASGEMPIPPQFASWRDYYTNQTRTTIERRYARDIAEFGYGF